MNAPDALETKYATKADSSGPVDFRQFDRHTQRQAYQGLSRAAMVYSVAYLAAYGLSLVLEQFAGEGRIPPVHSLVVAAVSVAGSAVIAVLARRRAFAPENFCKVGMGFAILASAGIVGSQWSWRTYLELHKGGADVGWLSVWILTFPALLTLTPRQVFVSGAVSMLLMPASVLLGIWREGLPIIDGEPTGRLVVSFLSHVMLAGGICVGIAVYMSSRIYNLTRDVSRARLLGNYRLDRPIGQGGMGEVWRATHHLLARPAAVKLIRGGKVGSSSSVEPDMMLRRFEREAQATAALTSPHTIELFDFGINDDGTFYYVMELLEGMDLRTLVEKTGAVPQERAVHFLRQACASLADAHGHGLVHRDVKPANLFTCRRGLEYDFVKVLDFGLVKESAEDSDATQLTSEGITSGTPAFMAPEMAVGTADVDARADIYALGCVAYWLLTGTLVFEAKSGMAMVVKHAKEAPVPPSRRTDQEIHPLLDELVLGCLEKERGQRAATVLELDRRLRRVQEQIGPWSPERAERWWRSHLPELTSMRSSPLTATSSGLAS